MSARPRCGIASSGRCSPLLLAGAALLWIANPAQAGSFSSTQSGADDRLQKSLQELSSVREKIAAQKLPLSRAVSELEAEVLELREQHARLLEVRDSRSIDLGSLRKQVESLGEQEAFVDSRLEEFVRDFEGRLDISELARFEALTAAAKLAKSDPNLDGEGQRNAQIEVVRAALQRLRDRLGGQVFEGEALSPEGVLKAGSFIAIGPSVYFASQDGELAGLVESQLNAADPVVVQLPGGFSDGIEAIAASGQGALPFDATLGKALKTEKARESLVQHLRKGGVVGMIILALGLSALLLAVFKAMEISRFPEADAARVDRVLAELLSGNQETAAQQARRVPGVAGEMLLLGVEHADEKRGLLDELLFEKILKARPTLERFLPFLAITATAAPLLGLLGTVTGMIKTFQLITIFGTGDAKSLSSGISEALVTTELGLVVAIPTLIVHGALTRMAKRKLGALEQLSTGFVNGVQAVRKAESRKPLTPAAPALQGV